MYSVVEWGGGRTVTDMIRMLCPSPPHSWSDSVVLDCWSSESSDCDSVCTRHMTQWSLVWDHPPLWETFDSRDYYSLTELSWDYYTAPHRSHWSLTLTAPLETSVLRSEYYTGDPLPNQYTVHQSLCYFRNGGEWGQTFQQKMIIFSVMQAAMVKYFKPNWFLKPQVRYWCEF